MKRDLSTTREWFHTTKKAIHRAELPDFNKKHNPGPFFALTNPGGKPSVVYQGENVGGGKVNQRQSSLKNCY